MICLWLVAIIVCMILFYNIHLFQNECNEHWIEQMKILHCPGFMQDPNFTTPYKFSLPTEANPYDIKDPDKDT